MKFVRTITALVTAPVAQNVALIRLAGPATYSIINKIFQRSNHRPLARKRGINFGQIITADGEVVDQVLLFCFVAPHSFTGEDLVEISCHGNIFIVNRIIEMLVKEGADLATAGEFSKQAFFNGKLNLIQAQAINELIRAPGAAATQLALDNLSPAKQQVINVIEDRLLSLIANIKVNIDYPEYDGVEYLTGKNSRQELQRIRQQITAIQQQSDNTDVFRQGLQVAIVGQPNVGKSTLLNSLTKTEKAFVSAQQGTTRDAIEVTHSLNGIPLSLVDTAGIRVATDEVEKIGIARSKAILDTAEFVLFVIDATRQWNQDDEIIWQLVKDKKHLVVLNKSDQPQQCQLPVEVATSSTVTVSAKNKDLTALETAMTTIFGNYDLLKENIYPYLSQGWQKAKLKQLATTVDQVIEELSKGVYLDAVCGDLEAAYRLIKEISGKEYQDDLLDIIFSKFCLGK